MPALRSPEQNRRMWSLAGRLDQLVGGGEGEARLRAVCKDVSGQTSTRALAPAQAALVIEDLKKDVALIERHKDLQEVNPNELPGKQQLETIQHLRKDLGMTPQGLQKICQRTIGSAWPQTRGEAIKVHEALSAMLTRQQKKKPGDLWNRIDGLLKTQSLTAWERNFLSDVQRRLDQNKAIPGGAWPKLTEIELKVSR